MNRAALTALYLDEVSKRSLSAGELLQDLPESELLNAFYGGRYLPRPLFISHAERERLYADVETVRAAVLSLPDRLYGGDFAAFASAAGASETFIWAAMHGRRTAATQLGRADMYADESGFRLLEFNLSSSIGGVDNADMCRALLQHPVLADFAKAHDLTYVDTMREQVDTIFAETGLAPGSFPVVAMAGWPSSYRSLGPYLKLMAARWRELGLDAHACHLGELQVRGGRVWLGERPVDAVVRMFFIGHLHESADAPALLAPILDAVARGEVKIFVPLDSDVFSSKASLAMISDEANRDVFTPAELASIDRLVPWSRIVRPGPVTTPDGSRADLLDYAIAHQHELALKPVLGHGGIGVLLGWDDISPEQWRGQVASAYGSSFILQHRIRPVPELFPDEDGELVSWLPVWGMFHVAAGYGGFYLRAARADADMTVINTTLGAFNGSCMSGPPPPGHTGER